MLSDREMSKPYAGRVAVVGAAVLIGLLGSAGTAAALPGSGSASGSAAGSADLASGSASGSASISPAAAAGAYLTWQSTQFIHNTLRMLLSVPLRNS
ncbi:hypothetical protein ATK86_4261 [Nocardia fluminea]|uniref:Uncharacterized protein n=2 Tax=Nocardia fluminea TaxID=134984 RepID=A0A2N3VE32_9NOCA|nr:hypothetical protein ATK86_4261 [Nocardia fluminea]